MLSGKKYIGEVLRQKTYIPYFLTRRQIKMIFDIRKVAFQAKRVVQNKGGR